jgi:hypothetical protein
MIDGRVASSEIPDSEHGRVFLVGLIDPSEPPPPERAP